MKLWCAVLLPFVVSLIANIIIYKNIVLPYLAVSRIEEQERKIQRELPCTSKGMVYYKPYRSDAICLPTEYFIYYH